MGDGGLITVAGRRRLQNTAAERRRLQNTGVAAAGQAVEATTSLTGIRRFGTGAMGEGESNRSCAGSLAKLAVTSRLKCWGDWW